MRYALGTHRIEPTRQPYGKVDVGAMLYNRRFAAPSQLRKMQLLAYGYGASLRSLHNMAKEVR